MMLISSLQYKNTMAVMEMVIFKLFDNVPCVELFLAFEIKNEPTKWHQNQLLRLYYKVICYPLSYEMYFGQGEKRIL